MGSISFGGDPENYMDAPQLNQKDKPGSPSIIAQVLALLGITRPVAKEPKEKKSKAPVQPEIMTQPPAPAPQLPAVPMLQDLESMFKPAVGLPADWGQRYLDSMKPAKSVEPNLFL